MKICLFHNAFKNVGGAEVLASMHGRYLKEVGDQVDLVTFDYDGKQWGEAFRDIGLHLVDKHAWSDLVVAWDRSLQLKRRGKRAEGILKALDADMVLAHSPVCCAMLAHIGLRGAKAWYCCEPYRKLYPAATTPNFFKAMREGLCHRISPGLERMEAQWKSMEKPGWQVRRQIAFDKEGVQGMDLVIADSVFCKENAEAVYERRDVQVSYPMVQFPREARNKKGLDRSGLKILIQSRLEALKNIDTVLYGFALARHRLGSAPQVHVVGEGKERSYLEQLCSELNLESHVHFHGFLGPEKLAEVQGCCDVFALVPWDEPFGMVFPESAARGLLLLGPDHGGPMEILEGGRYGQVAPAHSPEAIGAALESFWSLSDEEADRRREEADKACRDRYAPEFVGPELRRLLARP